MAFQTQLREPSKFMYNLVIKSSPTLAEHADVRIVMLQLSVRLLHGDVVLAAVAKEIGFDQSIVVVILVFVLEMQLPTASAR